MILTFSNRLCASAQFQPWWPATEYRCLLVLFHRNVWALSHTLSLHTPAERHPALRTAPVGETPSTTAAPGHRSDSARHHLPVVSVHRRCRFLHGSAAAVEALSPLYGQQFRCVLLFRNRLGPGSDRLVSVDLLQFGEREFLFRCHIGDVQCPGNSLMSWENDEWHRTVLIIPSGS